MVLSKGSPRLCLYPLGSPINGLKKGTIDIFLHMDFISKLEDKVASNGKYRERKNQQGRKSPQPTVWAERPMNWFLLDETAGHSCTSEFLPSVNKEGPLA